MTFTYLREDDQGFWTDGRISENFLAGVQCGAETKRNFGNYEGVYGPCEGFVYFIAIGAPYISHVKVGFTAGDPKARMASLQTGCPYPMSLLGFVLGNRAQEAELHQVFEEYHTVGEWFEFAPQVETNIRYLLEGGHFA